MTKKKSPKNNITHDIIHKIHLTLSNIDTGEEILSFLKETEPVFMSEVSRFIHAEMHRLRYKLPEPQINYLGSVIGAAYIAGFLIAREADHKIYNGLINFDSPINKALDSNEIDKLIDKFHKEGKTNREIGKVLKRMIKRDTKSIPKKKKKKASGKRLKIKGLGE